MITAMIAKGISCGLPASRSYCALQVMTNVIANLRNYSNNTHTQKNKKTLIN